jgi:hypothetical protein
VIHQSMGLLNALQSCLSHTGRVGTVKCVSLALDWPKVMCTTPFEIPRS